VKLNLSTVLIFLVISLFCGTVILSLGIGAEFVSVNKVMGPVICGGGKLDAAWEYNVSHPHKTIYGSRWVCVDETAGTRQDASLRTNLIAGTIYGLLIFAAFIISWVWVNRPESK
jgi:hypothetical protein